VLSVLTVNIGAASQERARLLLDWLARRPEEVFVITETSAGPGTSWMLDRFRRAGFTVIKTPDADGERGSALVCRVRVVQDLTAEFAAVSVPCRVSAAVLGTEPAISVIGVYVPSRDRSADKTERKQRFIRTQAPAGSRGAAIPRVRPRLVRASRGSAARPRAAGTGAGRW